MNIPTLDLIIILAYLVLIILIGILSSRRKKVTVTAGLALTERPYAPGSAPLVSRNTTKPPVGFTARVSVSTVPLTERVAKAPGVKAKPVRVKKLPGPPTE